MCLEMCSKHQFYSVVKNKTENFSVVSNTVINEKHW